jgi:hypothetical protein
LARFAAEPSHEFDDPGVSYEYYPNLGLAVRWRVGHIEELVVAQIPRKVVIGQ